MLIGEISFIIMAVFYVFCKEVNKDNLQDCDTSVMYVTEEDFKRISREDKKIMVEAPDKETFVL